MSINQKQSQKTPQQIPPQPHPQNHPQLTPQEYYQWYNLQSNNQTYYSPQQYYQYYYYHNYHQYYNYNNTNYQNFQYQTQKETTGKSQKLSRNQKKKIKKNKLKQELQQQRKQIGKWVELQRKDLLDDIKKLQQKQNQKKQKKKQKLSHLIQIHKEINKLINKKNKNKTINITKQNKNNFRRKKKKPSNIKKMKILYAQLSQKIKNTNKNQQNSNQNNNSDDFQTQSQNQQENQSQKQKQIKQQNENENKKQKQQSKMKKQQKQVQTKQIIQQKQIKIINYNKIGKLTGSIYNGIILRQWVDHMPSEKLQDSILKFINKLAYRQAVKKVNQPTKARKLIISGLHQCRRTLWTTLDNKRSKLLIVALNIERNNLQKGTDDLIQQALNYANNASVPVVHISTRSKIGRAFTGKFGPRISMVSIVNFEGFQEQMDEIVNEWKQMKEIYDNLKGSFSF